jgi:hypothetical protein
VRRADNLTTFMCRLSRNLGASTSWNPKGLSRSVMELLYLYYHVLNFVNFEKLILLDTDMFGTDGVVINTGRDVVS